MQTKKGIISTEKLALGAIMTALVVLLQFMGSFIRFGPFSISLVLIPIVIGAATCGISIGAWLGLVFGAVVLISGDASVFLSISIPGTVITVLLKGICCGLAAGVVYKMLENKNRYLAVIMAAIVCPIVNTGIFILGSFVFFFDVVSMWGAAAGQGVITYIFLGLVGANFLFELGSNIILSPVAVRLIDVAKKMLKKK